MNRWTLPTLLVMLICVAVFLVPGGEEAETSLDGEDAAGAPRDPEAPILAGSGGVGTSPERAPRRRDWNEPPPPFKAWFLEASVTTVNTETPEPIAGATVVVYLQVGWDYERIAEGTSGPDGNVSIDLRFLATRSRTQLGLASLVAFVSAPENYADRGQPYGGGGRLLGGDLEPTHWWLRARLARGRALRGRVTRETGEPIHKASVSLVDKHGEFTGYLTFTDPGGWYALPIRGAGAYRIHSQRRGFRVFRSKPIVVEAAQALPAFHIKLRARAALPGVVRFQDGSPVADFTFEITHPAFDGHTYMWTPRVGPIRVQTDGLGGFATVLPAMTDYGQRIPEEFSVAVPGLSSKETGFDPTSRLLELTLPAHRLRVRLRDDHGAPLRAQKVSLHLDKPHRRSMSGVTDKRGEVSLFAPPGSQGTLRILRIGNALLVVPVSIPKAGNESTLRVDVPDRNRAGRLQFQIRTPAGGRVFPVDVHIKTPGGAEVVSKTFFTDADHIALPPGAYKVWLRSDAKPPWADLPGVRSFLRLPEPLVIRDGETTSVEVTWKRTAAIALRVTASDASGVEVADSHVLFERAAGERERFSLERKDQNWSGGVCLDEWMFSDQMYAPGLYRLTLEAKGYRSVTREVRLHDSRVSRIEIALERDP